VTENGSGLTLGWSGTPQSRQFRELSTARLPIGQACTSIPTIGQAAYHSG